RRYRTRLAIKIGLLLAGLACQSPDAKPRAEASGARSGEAAARDVRLARVAPATFEEAIEIAGTLAADEQVTLATKVPGRLSKIEIDLASPVKPGQLIAQIETTDYEFGVQQAQASLLQARAQLGLSATGTRDRLDVDATALVRQARATLEEARANETRLAKLADEGLTPQADLDAARATLVRAEASLESAREEVRLREAQMRQRESELAIARQRLEDTAIRSPIDGFVQARRASRGEYLAAGAAVAEVVRIDPLRLRLAVPEREATSLRNGQPVRVRVTGQSGGAAREEYTGTVARLAPSLDAQSRSLLIEADIKNPGSLRPGNFVQARIITGERKALTVPESAVVTFAGLQKVILVDAGKAVERPVTTGDKLGDRIEIVTGVRDGEQVVDVPGALQQGQPVIVTEGQPEGKAGERATAAPASNEG
ncbi:MAG TPA: efflux RND transporter periplasmic adaptor subunit, partial [Polyangiaceae bacterium]|nr:efflux RND transporter periplasmic adaptor subunit [Polyangiaceae bacterium]